LKADGFGHSRLFYSITQRHQELTNLLLEHLIMLAQPENVNSQIFLTSFYSVRNDIPLIIRNSSSVLDSFLSSCISRRDDVHFGVPYQKLPIVKFLNTSVPAFDKFIKNPDFPGNADEIPIRLKTTPFTLPSHIGSKSSMDFLISIIHCENENIFRTELIQNFIRNRWDALFTPIFLFTALMMINMILYVVIMFESRELYLLISLLI
jgi:hypothetical protein